MKGVAPEGITMTDIYRSVGPWVGIQAVGLIMVMRFPIIAMYLPNRIM